MNNQKFLSNRKFASARCCRAQFQVSQYADDATVFVKDKSSLIYVFKAISLYGKRSGTRLNISKTKAMWLGN